MLILVDDVSPLTIDNLHYLIDIHNTNNNIYMILFTIANHNNCNPINNCNEFIKFIEDNFRWIQVGVHGYDHAYPPEQERDNAKELTQLAHEILLPWLPPNPLYRPPGYQRTIDTEKIVKEAGFKGIAYQRRIKYFDGTYVNNFINCHLTIDKNFNPINKWREWLKF